MRCRICRQWAGWLRRRCQPCSALWDIYETRRADTSPNQLLSLFFDSGASREQVERFLQGDPDGHGTIQDRMATDTTNLLLAALGHSHQQTVADVARLRARGFWKRYDQRPEE